MVAIVTVLFALPLGYFCRSATAAYVGYVAVYGWAFSFQGVYLLMMWADEDGSAFPHEGFPWAYGLVTLAVYVAGFGLVTVGRLLRVRRGVRSAVPA